MSRKETTSWEVEAEEHEPTWSQIETIESLCEELSLDYELWKPSNLKHASDIIQELLESK